MLDKIGKHTNSPCWWMCYKMKVWPNIRSDHGDVRSFDDWIWSSVSWRLITYVH